MNLDKAELEAYLHAQIVSIDNWVWELGVTLNMNPLDIFSRSELASIWICRYAKTFHDNYFSQK